MANAKPKTYSVYSSHLNRFFNIRKFNEVELVEFIKKLTGKIKSNKAFDLKEYIFFLLENILLDFEKVAIDIESTPEKNILGALFECVTDIYNEFSLENINTTLMLIEDSKFRRNNDNEDEEKPKAFKPAAILPPKTYSDLTSIEAEMKKLLVGQDEAIKETMSHVRLLESGLSTNPNLFFIGPTGVGKTELAKLLARKVYGGSQKLLKINCGEYSQSHEYAKLIGSPPGYIGHNEKSLLTTKAEESNAWVIVFDEVEKAHDKLFDLLLNLMDEGTITDSKGTILDFSKSIICFTSNIGLKEFVGKTTLGFTNTAISFNQARSVIEKAFVERFSPEFRNRVDSVIYFNALTEKDAEKIVRLNLKKLPIRANKALVAYILKNAYSEEFGARHIRRFIKTKITSQLADEILKGNKDLSYKPIFAKGEFSGIEPIVKPDRDNTVTV